MIKAVIFDAGGVLVDEPFVGMVKYYSNHLGITQVEFENAYSLEVDAWQKGKLGEDDFWKRMSNHYNGKFPTSSHLWIDGFMSVYKEKTKIFQLIKTLKEKDIKIGLLSNTEIPNAEYMVQHFSDFDVFVFSCEVGLAKPGKEIYELTLKKLGVEPSEAVFIDDKPENIEGAQKVGIKGILFESEEQVEKSVNKIISS